jgi:preprotein translocase subunit SecE
VSRDRRQRAKQRERRKAGAAARDAGAGELLRADVPGALDHASGEVDEFDAALVRGAGGVPIADEEADEVERAERSTEPAAATETVETETVEDLEDGIENGGGAAVGNVEDEEAGEGELPVPRERARPPAAPRGSLPSRAAAFLRASWAELQRVQWPDRPEVFQATAVVLGFVAVMGVYLGVADWVAQKIINFVL